MNENRAMFTVRFGMLCPPLQAQLAEQGLVLKDAKHWERRAKAVSELKVLGIISETECRKAERRLMALIQPNVRAVEK